MELEPGWYFVYFLTSGKKVFTIAEFTGSGYAPWYITACDEPIEEKEIEVIEKIEIPDNLKHLDPWKRGL